MVRQSYPSLSPVTTLHRIGDWPDWQRLGRRRRASRVRPDPAWKRKSLTASDPKTVVSDPERALSLVKLLPVEPVSATSVVGDVREGLWSMNIHETFMLARDKGRGFTI